MAFIARNPAARTRESFKYLHSKATMSLDFADPFLSRRAVTSMSSGGLAAFTSQIGKCTSISRLSSKMTNVCFGGIAVPLKKDLKNVLIVCRSFCTEASSIKQKYKWERPPHDDLEAILKGKSSLIDQVKFIEEVVLLYNIKIEKGITEGSYEVIRSLEDGEIKLIKHKAVEDSPLFNVQVCQVAIRSLIETGPKIQVEDDAETDVEAADGGEPNEMSVEKRLAMPVRGLYSAEKLVSDYLNIKPPVNYFQSKLCAGLTDCGVIGANSYFMLLSNLVYALTVDDEENLDQVERIFEFYFKSAKFD